MKANSDLTILICNYNHGDYIENLLISIERQTTQPDAIIIIDDGSNDKSHEVLKKYSNLEKYKIILNKINKGVIFRMNEGVNLIKTKYFMVCGADDIILNSKSIQISIESLNQYPEAGLSTGMICTVNNDYSIKSIINSPIISNKIKYFSPKKFIKVFEKSGPLINGHLTIVKTEYFKSISKEYPEIAQFTDICVFYSIAINYGLVFIPKVIGFYRLQDDGYASENFKNKFLTFKNFTKMIKLIEKNNLHNYNLDKFIKNFKLISRLFYYKVKINIEANFYKTYKKKFFYFFLNLKLLIYFLYSSPIFFITYYYYKINFFFRKKHHD